MEDELDEVSRDISETADKMCTLIRRCEATLQHKVNEAKEVGRKHFVVAKEELETAKDNTASICSTAETLHEASTEQALSTVLQAPINRQQFLHQQNIPLPSVEWILERSTSDLDQLSKDYFVGTFDSDKKPTVQLKSCETEKMDLGAPISTMKLEYTGKMAVFGIAPIHGNLICVHYNDQYIWVYTDDGQLKQKVQISGIDQLFGMVATDSNQGKLAVIGSTQSKVHLVSLSQTLEIVQHLTREVSIVVGRLSMGYKSEIVVRNTDKKGFVVLNGDGQIVCDVLGSLSSQNVTIYSMAQTKSGFVVCDRDNKKVCFTDASGNIMCTSTECKEPWCAVQTSWGHVLVADMAVHAINIFTDSGDFLGAIEDTNNRITYPSYIHIDEAARLLYVGGFEVRTYTFSPSELPPLPVQRHLTTLTANVNLVNI